MDAMGAARMVRGVQNAYQFLSILQLTDYMFSPQADVEQFPCYDFIVVGGGTAGCVVASRLAENENIQVLLIEAGWNPPIQSTLPSLLVYLKNSSIDWRYTTKIPPKPESCQKGSSEILSIGKVLGGTSVVNFILYSQGTKKDYDDWAKIVNDSSWTGESVLPYFIKSQCLEDRTIEESSDGDYYGYEGPIILTKDRSPIIQEYLPGFEEAGFNVRDDTNIENPVGFSPALYNIGNGVRQDTATTYISPKKDSPNLHVLRNALVTKILFDKSKKAVAVVVCVGGKNIKIKAKYEIIVSCGALNTPKLLMVSGIGPKKQLKRKGIEVIADLPVGKNLQYQPSTILVIRLKNTPSKPPYQDPHQYPASVITGYIALNKSSDQPDYAALNYFNYASALTLFNEFTYQFSDEITNSLFAPCGKYRSTDRYQIMYSVLANLKLKSRGEVSLRSINFKDQPTINLTKKFDSADFDDQIKYIQDFLKVLDTPTFKKLGAELMVPELKNCDDLELYSDEYWLCYLKCMASVRPLFGGTTAMGSVVDSRLRVNGVKNLRVVDAGVMPVLPKAVLLGPTVMIAEKAADMIKEDNSM